MVCANINRALYKYDCTCILYICTSMSYDVSACWESYVQAYVYTGHGTLGVVWLLRLPDHAKLQQLFDSLPNKVILICMLWSCGASVSKCTPLNVSHLIRVRGSTLAASVATDVESSLSNSGSFSI